MEEYGDNEGLIAQRSSRLGLDHFLHNHPLELEEISFRLCTGCRTIIRGQFYCCRSCGFYLCESCTNIPGQICHFIHSCPLFLVISDVRECDACGAGCSGFFYECRRCRWVVHYDCTLKQLPNTTNNPETQEQIEAPLHRHPLSIVEIIWENQVLCRVCEEIRVGRIYYECSVCNFYVHKSCVEIPRQLYSVYHNCRYFLVLLVCLSYNCGACKRGGFDVSYACGRCGLKLHPNCALRFVGKINKDLQLEHICHSTGALQKKTDCLGCRFPLEKPCSENLLQLQTPLHPQHTLFICENTELRRCKVCLGDCSSSLIFRCDKCDFNCDSKCIYLMPTVKFVNHDSHLLTVVDEIYGDAKCDACKKTCLGMPAFRCSECEFILHLLCGPLPDTIKYDHIHRLTLKDYVLDDYDEQYCYFCEEKRDPLLPVYNCKRCLYSAEIDCVMSEVMASLKGEREEHIVLRCINRQINTKNRVINRGGAGKKLELKEVEQNKDLSEEVIETEPSLFLTDIFDCLNEDEQYKFRRTIITMVRGLTCLEDEDMDDGNSVENSSCDNTNESIEETDGSETKKHYHSIPEVSPYSEKAFIQLIEKLDSSVDSGDIIELVLSDDEKLDSRVDSTDIIKLVLSDDEKQLVKYGKYITPRIFIPILKDLTNGKYGDISSESMLDPRVKSICLMYLSELIYSMQTTKVVQIKKDKLQAWWHRTKMLQLVGFKVDFIQDHLMLVARSYFGLRARNFADKTSQKQVSEIKRLEKEIKDLMATVEELKVEHRNHIEYVECATTPFMVKCFSDAKAMKFRPAVDGLL